MEAFAQQQELLLIWYDFLIGAQWWKSAISKQVTIYGGACLCPIKCFQPISVERCTPEAVACLIWTPGVCLTWVYASWIRLFCDFWHKERVPRAVKWSEMMPQYERTFHKSCLFWQEAVHIWQVSNPGRMTYAVALLPAAQGMFLSISGLHMVCGYELLQYFISSSFWKCTIRVIMQNMKVE